MRLSSDEFRALGRHVVDMATAHLSDLTAKPVFKRLQEDEREGIAEMDLPDAGVPAEELLKLIADRVLPHPMGNGHPRFFGWVNSPPAPMAVLVELLAAAMNPSCAGGDHAAIYLERCVTRWLMELIGFPTKESFGLLVSGGSMASLTALAAARHWRFRDLGIDVRREGVAARRLRLYASMQTHSCIQKSVELLGLGSDAIRWIEVDGDYRIRVQELASAVLEDKGHGFVPFCIVGNAGTVNTGAIDPLDALADIAQRFGLWVHVDGSYGALGKLDDKVASLFRGLERADTIALDPHKWLSVPVECGCLLVRDSQVLRDAFSLVPPYLRTHPGKGIGNLPWFSEYGFQQSRGFRALKLWATLAHTGRKGFASQIARHNALARYLERRVQALPDLELCSAGNLSIVCFRCRPDQVRDNEEALNALNRQVMERVQSEGSVFLTSAVLRERFVLRACILHYATTEQDIDIMLNEVRRVASAVAGIAGDEAGQ
jgi:glutamate/tyrosine decarboxylase-like PLP-dependent enzyme